MVIYKYNHILPFKGGFYKMKKSNQKLVEYEEMKMRVFEGLNVSRRQVSLQVEPFPQTLVSIIIDIIDGVIELAEVQRDKAWTPQQESEFIASFLEDPAVVCSGLIQRITFVEDRTTGKKKIVDGQQRLSTLFKYLLGMTIPVSHRIDKSILEVYQEKVQQDPKFRFFKVRRNVQPLSLNLKRLPRVNAEIAEILHNKNASFLPIENQRGILDLIIPMQRVVQIQNETVQDTIKRAYANLNAGVPLNNEEKWYSEFSGTPLMDFIDNEILDPKFEELIGKKDLRYRNMNYAIDTFSYLEGKYTSGNRNKREAFLQNHAQKSTSVNNFKRSFKSIIEVGKVIFGEDNLFGSYDEMGNNVNKGTSLAAFLPWAVVLRKYYQTATNESGLYTLEQFQEKREEILREWKKVSIKNTKASIKEGASAEWAYLSTDQSNNPDKLNGRVNIVENLIKYVMEGEN